MTSPGTKTRSKLDFWQQLVAYAQGDRPALNLFGEYGTLQHLNLVHLQTELAKVKAEIYQSQTTTEAQMQLLRQTLHDYATAIRDHEYMKGLVVPPNIDDQQMSIMYAFPALSSLPGAPLGTRYLSFPSVLPREEDAVREILRKYLPRSLSWTAKEKKQRLNDYYQRKRPEVYSPIVDKLARFIMAFAGGASLIIPMLIMSFDASRNKSLITVSVSVLLFAVFLSSGIHASNQETLAATATYAAVLVVFVGTSGSSS